MTDVNAGKYTLEITNTLGLIENESYGMREFLVVVDYVTVF